MRALSRVHLNGLRAAEAVGRLGSLSRAAEETGVTVGAVSQHILKLERQLGRSLFERTHRGLLPTRAGERFLAQLSRGMAVLDGAVAESLRTGSNMLVLSVAPVFAARWLVPRLARFNRLHPEVNVRLEATVTLVDLDSEDIDLAIRVGHGNWPAFETRLLLPQDIFPVAAPEVAARLKAPEDLCRVPIVRDIHSNLRWCLWLAPFGIAETSLREGPSFTDASLCLDSAIAGQGVMLAWDTLAQDAIAAGKLAVPFSHRASTGLGYWLLASRARRASPAIRNFSHWIIEEMATIEARPWV